ncbi:CRISPR-associated protein Cmr2 [Thermosyntropha lipolytica DSM 11003]|uniref:CRISPR-associated protein Cmr2 n=1 Tax=Thermosyntropha lipolytica DSM 11003 TaxID=1123382 RepID=A0A1M5RNE0_9FIRM|nr:RAMP superfamily CRISPR-associated protein [Thermosyntropha lipolytica]SHH27857.1 CRISPR-associated protein Cmr2 [Thermosyntropha lipolytica DSM 11003]
MAEEKHIYESFLASDIPENYISRCKNYGFHVREDLTKVNRLRAGVVRNWHEQSFLCREQYSRIMEISGIKTKKEEVFPVLETLPAYSFVLWARFKLKQPYFSRDDEELYLVHNPVLKDKAFKVPVIRGSGWKGNIASVLKDIVGEKENKRTAIESYFRLLGAGSEYIKALEEELTRMYKDEEINGEKVKSHLFSFLLFELGIRIEKDLLDRIKNLESEEDLEEIIYTALGMIGEEEEKTWGWMREWGTRRGRAIFYPTFFDSITLEVINPHHRRRRAGRGPVFYEAVPAGSEGILQIAYVPFTGVFKRDEEVKKEVEEDLRLLLEALERLAERGLGAKTRWGWGTFAFYPGEKCCFIKGGEEKELEFSDRSLNGWEIIEGGGRQEK